MSAPLFSVKNVPNQTFTSCCFHTGSSRVIIGTLSGNLLIYDQNLDNCVETVSLGETPILTLSSSKNVFASNNTTDIFTVRVSDHKAAKVSVLEYASPVSTVASSPNRKFIFFASHSPSKCILLDSSDLDTEYPIESIQDEIMFATFDPTGQYCTTITANGLVHIISTKSHRVVQTFSNIAPRTGPDQRVVLQSSFQHHTGGLCAIPTRDRIAIYTMSQWSKAPWLLSISPQQGLFTACQFAPNDAILAAVTDKHELCLFNTLSRVNGQYVLLTTLNISQEIQTLEKPIVQLVWNYNTVPTNQDNDNEADNEQLAKYIDLFLVTEDGNIISVQNPCAGLTLSNRMTSQDLALLKQTVSDKKSVNTDMSDNLTTDPIAAATDAAVSIPSHDENQDTSNNNNNNDDNVNEDEAVLSTPKKQPPTPSKRQLRSDVRGAETPSSDIPQSTKKSRSNTGQRDSTRSTRGFDAESDDDEQRDDDDDDEDYYAKRRRNTSSSSTLDNAELISSLKEQLLAELLTEIEPQIHRMTRKNLRVFGSDAQQETFMPTATTPYQPNPSFQEYLSILHVSEAGNVVLRQSESTALYSVTRITPSKIEKVTVNAPIGIIFTQSVLDQSGVALASPRTPSLSQRGMLSSSEKKVTTPSTLFYQSFATGGTSNSEGFQVTLPPRESIECLALSKDIIAVATSMGYLRLFTLSGFDLRVLSIAGKVLTMTAKGSYLAVYYHSPALAVTQTSHIMLRVYHTESLQVVVETSVPLTPNTDLTWVYISAEGIHYTYDSAGILRGLFTSLGNDWVVLCEAQQRFVSEAGYHVWPAYITWQHGANQQLTSTSSTQASNPAQNEHILHFYELYEMIEPRAALQLPPLKRGSIVMPMLYMQNYKKSSSSDSSNQPSKLQVQFETNLRQQLLYDEITFSCGEPITVATRRQLDAPWVILGVQYAQNGDAYTCVEAAKYIRDPIVLHRYIEKINSIGQTLPDIDGVIKQLKQLLTNKQELEKAHVYPYNQPPVVIGRVSSHAVPATTAVIHVAENNPFSKISQNKNGPNPNIPSTPLNPFSAGMRKSATPVSAQKHIGAEFAKRA